MSAASYTNKVRNSQGFTIIELMVVMAIIAVLTMIAIPAYQSFTDKAALKTAQSDLVSLSLNYENYYQRTLSYPSKDYPNVADLKAAFSSWNPASKSSQFSFSTTGGTTTTYTLVATASGGDISGCKISLSQDGTKSIASCGKYSNSGDWL